MQKMFVKDKLGLSGVIFRLATIAAVVFAMSFAALAQSTATLQGTVVDSSNAAVPNAKVTVHNDATGVERVTQTDQSGAYLVAGLLPGTYQVTVSANGFQSFVVKDLKLDVATTVVENAQLKVGQVNEQVVVTGGAPLVDTSNVSVGQVINERTVQQIPLNGRHFVDLGLLVPGTVTPPQNGFLTAPLRGQGSFAIDTAGQREDTTNWLVNGMNLSDEVQNQITFQPSINTVSEFKIDNSTFPAEYGRNSGAIVNIATRSGTNDFHGEVFDFVRNNAFDARNFFNPTQDARGNPNPQSPFIRNNFGAAAGGPIKKNKAFFFATYEGTRQRQALSLKSFTLSQQQQAQVAASSNSTIQKVSALLPAANDIGTGNPADPTSFNGFIGGAVAPVNIDQGTGDLSFDINDSNKLHGYYALQEDLRQEPNLQGNNLPGWGDTRASRRQIMTLEEDHIFGPNMTNEARIGYNRIHITFTPNQLLNPTNFAINDGITAPIDIPQISVSGLFNIGGPAGFPQGRGDTTVGFSDTLRYLHGNHSFAFGGEVRRFYNNNFNLDAGSLAFANICNFMADSEVTFTNGVPSSPCAGAPAPTSKAAVTAPNSFAVNLSNGASKLLQPAWGWFVEDSYKIRSNVTLELGFRYDYNSSISDSEDRFVVFDPATVELVQVGTNGFDQAYHTNNKNFQPRVGVAWDPWGDGKTSVRAGYAILTDQPVTNIVTGLTTNPPFGQPISFRGNIGLSNAAATAGPSGLAPSSVFRGFDNPYVQSYNLTIQREITSTLGVQVGYVGSKGTHLRLSRNLNEPDVATGALPFPTLSASSPIDPGTSLGNISEVDSSGISNYNALWVTANKHFANGLQFSASYTLSKSLDYNSLSSQGVTLEDSTNPRLNYGPSDFDARNRFVINAVYDLPFKGNRLVSGWEVAGISQAQSGNPLTLIVNNSAVTGGFTLRPDASGAIQTTGDPANWIANPGVLSNPSTGGVFHFGNVGRNTVIGPSFVNTDFSVIKHTKINERLGTEFRAEIFDIFNHPNFGNPNLRFGSSTFGLITSTRFPTGDFGSSRQIQLALKLTF